MGYLFAIITSVFFTAYTIPKKISKQTPSRYSLFQAIGLFGASLIAYLVHVLVRREAAETLLDPKLLFMALSGAAWFFGCIFFFRAIDSMGLSQSNQWKNFQGPFGTVFNLLFLAEYQQVNLFLVSVSCILILVSAMVLTVKKEGDQKFSYIGILYALIAAVLFGFNSMLLKYGTNQGFVYSQQVVHSGTVLICAIVYLLVTEHSISCIKNINKKDNFLGVLGGIIFYGASFFSLHAYSLLPGSITFTIIQLNSVWTILAGVLIFKEIDFKKNWGRIVMGIVFAVAGVLILMQA